jgi:peptidoglycan hydrolase CwlO-like protein
MMRRNLVIGLALISLVLLGAAAVSYSKYKKSQADYAKATADQENMRLRYDRAVEEIVSIQDSLNAIVLGGDQTQGDVELQQPGNLHDQVLSRITTLKASIARTKGRIEELDARLKHSGVRIASMQRMIDGLRRSATYKEERIAELSGQVDTLRTRVTGLSFEIQGQQEVLAKRQEELTEKQRELATIYYAMGTKNELKRSGVVDSKGGVLGVGKSLKLSGMFEEAAFSPLNTDQENVIRIPAKNAKKVQVLSAQPPSSYALQTVGKDMVELRILDRNEFRKIKHLVILRA